MTKEIIWTSPVDGRTQITIPCDNVYVPADSEGQPDKASFVTFMGAVPSDYRKATIEEIAIRDMAIMGVTEYHIVDRDKSMSMDNYFRDAWVHTEGDINVDMGKAVEVHKERLRELRASEMAALDVAYMRADEAGDNAAKQTIAARKQTLRDITKHPEIEAASTPEELKVAGISDIYATEEKQSETVMEGE